MGPPAAHSTEDREREQREVVPYAIDRSLLHASFAPLVTQEQLEAALAERPPLDLAALEVIAELGGKASWQSIASVVAVRAGVAPSELKQLAASVSASRVAIIGSPAHAQQASEALLGALVHPTALEIARAVRGLTLPAPPPPDTPPTRPGNGDVRVRDRVALLGALAHQSVRWTASESPHRTYLRKFANSVGVDEEYAEQVITHAARGQLLGARGFAYVPLERAIRDRIRSYWGSVLDPVAFAHTWLPRDRWTSLEALVRAIVRLQFEPPASNGGPRPNDHDGSASHHERAREQLANMGSVDWLEWNGATFVRPATRTFAGDGHVTPSFEVMLGPSADPDLTFSISLGAEPVRFDRVLTFRITPASISSGTSCGLTPDVFLEALEHVGPHGAPDNVRMMVREWFAHQRVGRARRAWVLEAPPEMTPALAKKLGEHVVGQPAPGILLVDDACEEDVVERAFDAAKVRLSNIRALRDAVNGGRPASFGWIDSSVPSWPSLSDLPASPLPLAFEGMPSLAERVRRDLPAAVEALRTRTVQKAPAPAPSHDANEIKHLADALRSEIESDWASFVSRLSGAARAEADATRGHPFALLPWSLLSHKWRRRVGFEAKDLGSLRSRARSLLSPMRVSRVGGPVLDLLGSDDGLKRLQGAIPPEIATAVHANNSQMSETRTNAATSERSTDLEIFDEPRDIVTAFERAAADGATVSLALKADPKHEWRIRPERIVRTGSELRLLATDESTDEARSFSLERVLYLASGENEDDSA